MDHLYLISRKFKITLADTSIYNTQNKNQIKKITKILSLKRSNTKAILALFYLLAMEENDAVVQKFRNHTGLTDSLYDIDSEQIKQYYCMLISALTFNSRFYPMAVNCYGAIRAGLNIGKIEEDELTSEVLNDTSEIYIEYSDYFFINIKYITIQFPFYIPKKGKRNSEETENLNIQIKENTDNIKINPNDHNSLIKLAGLYLTRNNIGDIKKAIEFANKALEIKKDESLPALLIRGLAYYKENLREKALNDLEEIIKLDKHNLKCITYYTIGSIHLRDGEKEEACKNFEKVKAIDPKFADIQKIFEDFL